MRINIYKFYDRPTHSYLSYIETAASVGEDAHIFVVKNDKFPAEESATPEESSDSLEDESSSAEEASPIVSILEYTRCDEQPGIPEIIYVQASVTADVIKVTLDGFVDAYCYEILTGVPLPGEVTPGMFILDGYSVCESCLGTLLGGENSQETITASDPLPKAVDLPIDRDRVLYTVASLTDMGYYGTVVPEDLGLYRASSVAMIFRSEKEMQVTLDELVNDIVKNVSLQAIESASFEVFTAEDGVGVDFIP
jgi:hypothetical protein